MRALIVEDDEFLGFLWSETLESAGFDIELVDSCRDAVDRLIQGHFDVCVLDLHVSDGTTTTLADWIKIRSPGTGVIAVTGNEQGARGELSLHHGFDFVFRKSVPVADLTAVAQYAAFVP